MTWMSQQLKISSVNTTTNARLLQNYWGCYATLHDEMLHYMIGCYII